MRILPVILSGGSGTRLWPLSREYSPKQLLAPFGEHTLLQGTIRRLEGIGVVQDSNKTLDIHNPLIICNEEHRFLVAEQLRQIDIEPDRIMLEPFGRNTAPAMTLAALQALKDDPVLLVMPADHIILDKQKFHLAVMTAAQLAEQGKLVTFGIVPTRPETGYGYIRLGEKDESINLGQPLPGYRISEFVEKPDPNTAAKYFESRSYLWNSGLFVTKASTWIENIKRFDPLIYHQCKEAIEKGEIDGDFFRIDSNAFQKCPSDSIDYAVMEKISSVDDGADEKSAVVPLDAGWSDVGAWSSLWDVVPQDENGNIVMGDVKLIDTKGSLFVSDYRLVAGIGLEDVIVIDSADAVMVAHKNSAQDIKKIVERLKEEGREECKIHRRVHRPWGDYEGIDIGERYQVKRITVKPGASLSLQMHHYRAEHWIVVKGTAKVTRGNEEFLLSENESTYIPIGVNHRLENPGSLPLEIIEVQSGSYLGEDDIVRFDDEYGRN
ncbi:MAG: mannose-1-phosphate guanylyltransferase/mannose-6-phosphate isomerase [Gammaproteobacteria bacterium]